MLSGRDAADCSSTGSRASLFKPSSIKTRLSVQTKHAQYHGHVHYAGFFDAFTKIFEQEGVWGLYAGVTSTLGNTVAQNFAYFYWYGFIRGWYQKKFPGAISTAMELLLGAIAGAISQMFTLPLAVISTRQQTAMRNDKKSVLGTFWQIVNEEGWQSLWKGWFLTTQNFECALLTFNHSEF